MTHDINDLNTFSTAYQDNAPQGDGLCRINWLNGDPSSRTPGAFFVTRRRIEDHNITVEGSPWREIDRAFRSGSSEIGYEARALKLAVLGVRQHHVTIDSDGVMTYIPRPPRDMPKPGGWSLYVEVLVMAQGLDTPVVWSSKRIKTSMGLVSMLRDYRTTLLEPFRRERKNPGVPSWAFWLPVRGEIDTRKQPVYEKTKGSPVTPPKLILPDGDVVTMARALYVGKALLERGEALRAQYDEWLRESPSTAAAAPVTSPVSEDDPYAEPF